jgi:AcrR family transcriptional regulator
MSPDLKTRRYSSPRREEGARRTRKRIITAARSLFLSRGYGATPVAAIAKRARVSVDTIYASVGRKPDLIREVIDDALGEGRGSVPVERRGYVEDVRAAPDAQAKIGTYAAALGRLQPTVAPLTEALREAGLQDKECQAAWSALIERRATNMRRFAADLRGTGEVREDIDDDTVADIVWATNSADYYLLLASRGWSADRYADHLTDLWTRLLLAPRPDRAASEASPSA